MADCLIDNGVMVVWNVPFSRGANDWELEDFASFFALLCGMVLRRGEEDVMDWMGAKDGVFSV